MKIDFANLGKAHQEYESEISEAINRVLKSSRFIMGEEVEALEEELCAFLGYRYAITCSSGTSAILLSLLAIRIKKGDEIITTPFSFIAAAEMIALIGAKPVFVDIDPHTFHLDANLIQKAITKKTKAILPVSLFGLSLQTDTLHSIAKAYDLSVIEDGAQSFGANHKNKKNLSKIITTSFFPSKPLGCYGDGGAVFCNDKELADTIKSLRIHGQNKRYKHSHIGLGARLDALQAAILRVKLKHYPLQIIRRQEVAKTYQKYLADKPVILPQVPKDRESVYAQYCILSTHRKNLEKNLEKNNIPYAIHYPKPLHLQACFNYLGYQKGDFKIAEQISKKILSLPMNPYLSENEIAFICKHVI
ncbi:aminotransferase DegT [Helicobacter sp. 12S02232-10]|uniref:DegT/DnrJ/EryC1/StrS family aminotransferase n=1 Tax=Helicobacter sp. 12S02232-10 TaxID=1476197 RepID=UPI000BA57BF3|nr:DegT/DnrJ/EryC1/StrS family aminotransferase [Helicobacter sp. 12S02232-10]PAF48826.1 aminotransferase DegT [Helicobacter sp. 12S02232-10]